MVVLLLLIVGAQVASAQVVKDTTIVASLDTGRQTIVQPDTVGVESAPAKPKKFQPNPKKAGLYSAILPGMGQLYNREYWKVPVVYVGIGVAGYYFFRNLNLYQSYRKAYIGRINNPNPTDEYVTRYDNAALKQLQDDHSKYLNLTVLFSTIGYALQVIDAVTSAHLKNFDISRDISMRVSPYAFPNGAGMAMVINFK